MKKKFDFTAEMKEAQITKSTPQNEYLKEEKRLLGINVKELAELNDNVYGLRTDLTALVDLLGKYKLSITQDTVSIRPRACFSPSYNKVKSQTKHVWL
ncbi:hypothetical protein POY55_08785, partial [Phocaeicola vulgatus]|nr:hypothetical protein [Phocaeicola vulgatus]MDC1552018.1 hypothetical protein [Phocaeicola vulgatus]MDC1556150.1 hypothetical protein [Phocaeicola vulgatus]MDC1560390.1 hypothetical protein [Phocaeicola vulgatus]